MGSRSSRLGVISPEVMPPETRVMLSEILAMSPEKKVKSPEETNTDCKYQTNNASFFC